MSYVHLYIKEVVEQGPLSNNVSKTYILTKRALDIAVSMLAVLLFAPVMLLTALIVKASSRGAILHTKDMCGLKGIRFKTYEFNPMIEIQFIRGLPLLFNVLKGALSIVGPQPTPLSEIGKYDTWYYFRMSAKPGITGLWQVWEKNGTADEMMHVDLKYIRERSLRYDMRITYAAISLMLKKIKGIGKAKTF